MCDKNICEVNVICKKCGYRAQLYHNPDAGCIKDEATGRFVPVDGPPGSNQFPNWVVVVCQHKGCKLHDNKKFELFTKKDFKDLQFRPHCPICKQEMKPERDHNGKGDYAYRCSTENCHSHFFLAEYASFEEIVPNPNNKPTMCTLVPH
jgi:hypothetical protein